MNIRKARLIFPCIVSILAAGVILVSCTLPKFSLPNLTRQETPESTATAVFPTRTALSEDHADEQATSTETQTTYGEFAPLSRADFTAADGSISGLILFASAASNPFDSLAQAPAETSLEDAALWAIAVDGSQAGPLTQSSGAVFAAQAEGQTSMVVDPSTSVRNEHITQVILPAACDVAAGGACSGFQFAPNGRSLLFFSGPATCGQALTLYDLESGSELQHWPQAQWARFLQNGSILLSLGNCEEQFMYLYYPNKASQSGIGAIGAPVWNPSKQAFLMQIQGSPAVQAGLWGLNLDTSRVFLWVDPQRVIQDSPIWLPDGQHVVFQHRAYQYDDGSGDAILKNPRQIILMDAWTRSQRLLAYDPQYNYHLCSTTGQPCNPVSGDWLKVRRTLIQQVRFSADAFDSLPAARCALFGLDCSAGDEEILAINWKTGQMLPWDDANVPEPEPVSPYPPPDLEGQPVYRDPAGAFALYPGTGGQALWYVPQEGEPVLWVADGSGFVYLP